MAKASSKKRSYSWSDDDDDVQILSSISPPHSYESEEECDSLGISTSPTDRKINFNEKLGIGPKPKRPMTAFFRFTQEYVRPNLLKENPSLPITQVTKIAAEKWRSADQELKNKLTEEFQELMKGYRRAMEEYVEELSKVDKGILAKLQYDVKSKKEKRELKKLRTESGCPKRPLSAYSLYLKHRRSELDPSTSYKEIVAKISEEWKKLDGNVKAKYVQERDRCKEAYDKEMARWEREMRAAGNSHLLSPKKSSKF